MKYLFILHLLLVAALYGCRDKPDPVQEFIPGTYIRFSQHEYGTEYDTIIIIQNQAGDDYGVIRKWKYERVLDGVKLEPEYKRIITSARYNSKHKLLMEYETGEVYSFDVRQKILFNGPIKYQKL